MQMNAVYMRVLRRIAGCSRFDASCEVNDLQVRELLRQPSIDCDLAKSWLRCFSRIVWNRHKTLWVILRVCVQGKKLPWVNTLVNDLRELRPFASGFGLYMPHPTMQALNLVEFVASSAEERNELVNRFSYLHS